jgi:pimeloyl-ACP methyl ester carboxylesterase
LLGGFTNLKHVLKAYAGGTVFGETYGAGPARVVFLHGWARSARDFRSAATTLANSGVASVALDLPGFGSSPAPSHAGGARFYAELLASVLCEISEHPVVVVGHSLGGRVAICLGARYPERVRKLILVGAPLVRRSSRRAPWRYSLIRRLARWHLVGDSTLERARQRYGSADYRASSGIIREILVMMINESYDEELAQWHGPTTLLWGADDHDVPVAVAHAARELLGGPCDLRIVANAGHLTITDAPEALVEVVKEALA